MMRKPNHACREAIVLNPEIRRQLERQTRGRSVPMRAALRSRMVLLAAEGKQHKQISEGLKIRPADGGAVGTEISAAGGEGLLKDAPRPGRNRTIQAAMVNTVIKKTTQTTPANATHWSTRTMAREVGISEASVRRIWHARGLRPHLVKTFKISHDPEFVDKLEAIVGLYQNPPGKTYLPDLR